MLALHLASALTDVVVHSALTTPTDFCFGSLWDKVELQASDFYP